MTHDNRHTTSCRKTKQNILVIQKNIIMCIPSQQASSALPSSKFLIVTAVWEGCTVAWHASTVAQHGRLYYITRHGITSLPEAEQTESHLYRAISIQVLLVLNETIYNLSIYFNLCCFQSQLTPALSCLTALIQICDFCQWVGPKVRKVIKSTPYVADVHQQFNKKLRGLI